MSGYEQMVSVNTSDFHDFGNNTTASYWSVGVQSSMELHKRWLTYYLMGIGGVTLCCLGIIGNTMSLLVLSRKSMRLSTYIYLLALSFSDLLVSIATLMMLINDTRVPQPSGQSESMLFYAYVFPYVHPIALTFQVTSIWLILGFTVDRYIMICHPFTSERLCTIKRARYVSLGLYLGGIIFNIPRFFEYRTIVLHIDELNITKLYTDLTEIGSSVVFIELIHSWFYLIFVYGIPFVTLAVLNAFLIRAVHLSRKRGREINASERKRNDTTVMLIGVVIVFFVCQFPALISRMMYAFNISIRFTYSYRCFSEVGNFLVVLNSAINIVPYYFFGKKFQKEFWLLFCSPCVSNYEFNRRFSNSVDQRRMSHVSNNIELRKQSKHSILSVPLERVSRNSSKDSNTSHPLVKTDNGYLTAENIPADKPVKNSSGICWKKLSWRKNCFKNLGGSSNNDNGKLYTILCFKLDNTTTEL